MVYQSIKHRKRVVNCLLPHYLVDIFVRDGGKHFFEEIYDGGLYKAAESFEDEINITNKDGNEAKTVEKSRFVELSEDDKILPAARVFYISLVFSNARHVLSQCNTWLKLLYLLYICYSF